VNSSILQKNAKLILEPSEFQPSTTLVDSLCRIKHSPWLLELSKCSTFLAFPMWMLGILIILINIELLQLVGRQFFNNKKATAYTLCNSPITPPHPPHQPRNPPTKNPTSPSSSNNSCLSTAISISIKLFTCKPPNCTSNSNIKRSKYLSPNLRSSPSKRTSANFGKNSAYNSKTDDAQAQTTTTAPMLPSTESANAAQQSKSLVTTSATSINAINPMAAKVHSINTSNSNINITIPSKCFSWISTVNNDQ
jgi:hypothetical protein